MPKRAIGIFDSGLGGLTVVRAVAERLPSERLVYLGDTARVPYGTKSAETVERYSLMSARFLLGRDIKLLLVACNTASAFALPRLHAELPIPVLGAVEPGADEAVRATVRGQIGVLGTLGTVHSNAYVRAIAAHNSALHVTQVACPLLVPLVEEGWLGEGTGLEPIATRATVERYLGELALKAPDLDVLVLGCTHYPLLWAPISEAAIRLWPHPVTLVDSAHAMAQAAETVLREQGALAPAGPREPLRCYVTDEARFSEIAARFLGTPPALVEKVDL